MADYAFNTPENQEVARDMLLLYLNTGTNNEPVWSPIGFHIEESDVELDWQRESKKDIMGQTYTTMKKPIKTQQFNAWPFMKNDAALVKVHKLAVIDEDAQALCNMDVLTIHKYAGTKDTAVLAIREESSSIELTRFGGPGGGSVTGDMTVTYGGKRTVGTADLTNGTVNFSPATE